MKEREFLEERLNHDIIVKVYYSLDEEGNVILDDESMAEEFEMRLEELKEITKEEDNAEEHGFKGKWKIE